MVAGHYSVPHTSFWHGCESGPFPDELEGPLVLGDLKQLLGALLIEGKSAHTLNHVLHELGVFGAVLWAAVRQLAHVLDCLVALSKTHGHGWHRAMAASLQWLLWQKGPT